MSVGYEYESCLDVVLWEKRTAALQGYELDASNMGGWMLNKHHVLDVQSGKETPPCARGRDRRPLSVTGRWSLPPESPR